MTGTLIATIGPPGAGKSTWRRRHAPAGATVVNLDANRAILSWCHCESNQEATPWAVELGVVTARAALARGGTVLWDATNAEPVARRMLQVLAAEYGAYTSGVLFLPLLTVALERNAGRDPRQCMCGWSRRVPDEVITRMHESIIASLPTLRAEGWSSLYTESEWNALSRWRATPPVVSTVL